MDRFKVVDYSDKYAVVDFRDHSWLSEHRSRDAAHRRCRKANREHLEARDACHTDGSCNPSAAHDRVKA
jgi:hypothetical protein